MPFMEYFGRKNARYLEGVVLRRFTASKRDINVLNGPTNRTYERIQGNLKHCYWSFQIKHCLYFIHCIRTSSLVCRRLIKYKMEPITS